MASGCQWQKQLRLSWNVDEEKGYSSLPLVEMGIFI